jgi:hypothetical protein
LTTPLALEKSIWPAKRCFSVDMHLPTSRSPSAPGLLDDVLASLLDFFLAHLLGQKFENDRRFRAFLLGEIKPAGLLVSAGGLAALLDHLGQDIVDFRRRKPGPCPRYRLAISRSFTAAQIRRRVETRVLSCDF